MKCDKHSDYEAGIRVGCKACIKRGSDAARSSLWVERNRQRNSDMHRLYRTTNAARMKTWHQQYYVSHREQKKAAASAYYYTNHTRIVAANRKHRLEHPVHPLSGIWYGMHSRCENPNVKEFAYYGARGITVCARWSGKIGFENFVADMGPRPAGKSLERVVNSKGYCPSNCVWATPKTQQRNTRHNRILILDGKAQCVAAWAEDLGIKSGTLCARLRMGWSTQRTLTTPVHI